MASLSRQLRQVEQWMGFENVTGGTTPSLPFPHYNRCQNHPFPHLPSPLSHLPIWHHRHNRRYRLILPTLTIAISVIIHLTSITI